MNTCSFKLPEWLVEYEKNIKLVDFDIEDDIQKMKIAVQISKSNVLEKTGGPFGSAIFINDGKHSKLHSVGTNLVTTCNNCTLHGEMVAIQMGQKRIEHFSFSGGNYELYTSCEPCAMCLGAILWSGVKKVVCAATKDDAESIGFNEGPVFPQSYQSLKEADIKVRREVLRSEALDILKMYKKNDGKIYNG